MSAVVEAQYEPCIVSFIDVLGFKSLVETKSANEIRDVLLKLQEFTSPGEPIAPGKGPRFISEPFSFMISDAIIRVRPYDTEHHDGALFHELYDLTLAQIALLASGVIIRAGVTVGDAYVGASGKGPVFGPAIARAYEIESKCAKWSRIVIDNCVIEQHRSDFRLRSSDNDLEYESDIIKSFIHSLDDELWFLDYMRFASEDDLDYVALIQDHARLIRENLDRSTDRKVRRKYVALARYHNDHIRKMMLAEMTVPSYLSDSIVRARGVRQS